MAGFIVSEDETKQKVQKYIISDNETEQKVQKYKEEVGGLNLNWELLTIQNFVLLVIYFYSY